MRKLTNILITGGAGFIGSNLIQYLFNNTKFNGKIINVDKLTYAGNLENLLNIDHEYGKDRYYFEIADITDYEKMKYIFKQYNVDTVIHLAAESHVDRSIHGPKEFINTNIIGTFTLLEISREYFKTKEGFHFHHVSTDEVFGSLNETGYFIEGTPYDPRSPYSASKASSDHLVQSYYHTYGLPITISNCSNNYGPFQFPEKLIPLMILNMTEGKSLPIYGDGKNIRDWLYVDDHNSAVWAIINNGRCGETYNIGGENEWENIRLVEILCEKVSLFTNKNKDYYKQLIKYIKDRPGHDRRYAINCDKIKTELGWKQNYSFDNGLDKTIEWYLNNENWIERIRSGEYKDWVNKNYNIR